ncbi:MAG: serine hydrolase [Anaerolineaceae bacterium]|nr:serine hydrolase [Anaerolineaceae bacterium]
MFKKENQIQKKCLILIGLLMNLVALVGCDDPGAVQATNVSYTPTTVNVFPVSTPEEQGLDPDLVSQLFAKAAEIETAYHLMVFKNGYLVAEDTFNNYAGAQENTHSVTKSFTSALVGIAIEEGCITGVDQKMMDFFPEYKDQIDDPRKFDITIQQMLQMRAGFPWEESNSELFDLLVTGFHTDTFVHVPLVRDPGTDSEYSNLTPHILGIIVARACGTDLASFAQEHLFDPLGITPGFWQTDWDGNHLGFADLHLSAVDMAKFGLMMSNDGMYDGQQIVPADWVEESLKLYSKRTWKIRVGRNWKDNGYSYQWWSIKAGNYRYHLAWGHGGQQIIIVDDLDLVAVILVDPMHLVWNDQQWKNEKASLNLMADFVASLP